MTCAYPYKTLDIASQEVSQKLTLTFDMSIGIFHAGIPVAQGFEEAWLYPIKFPAGTLDIHGVTCNDCQLYVKAAKVRHCVAAIFYACDLSLTSSCIPPVHQSYLDTLKNDLICIYPHAFV